MMMPILDGCFTIKDEELYPYLAMLSDREGIRIEPSACASFPGPIFTSKPWPEKNMPAKAGSSATHIIWATGGSMVPEEEMESYYLQGKQ